MYPDDASASHTLDEIATPDVHRVVSKVLVLDCGNIADANIEGS
jgi:hypothetical protein